VNATAGVPESRKSARISLNPVCHQERRQNEQRQQKYNNANTGTLGQKVRKQLTGLRITFREGHDAILSGKPFIPR